MCSVLQVARAHTRTDLERPNRTRICRKFFSYIPQQKHLSGGVMCEATVAEVTPYPALVVCCACRFLYSAAADCVSVFSYQWSKNDFQVQVYTLQKAWNEVSVRCGKSLDDVTDQVFMWVSCATWYKWYMTREKHFSKQENKGFHSRPVAQTSRRVK